MFENNLVKTQNLETERRKYRDIFNNIMNLSPKIRFLTIIDSEGRLMAGGQRDGISNYLSPQTEKESLRHAMDAWKLRQKFSNQIGDGIYALAKYSKIKRITIPFDRDHLLYMTTEVDENHDNLIENILRIKDR
ncbi:MAG: hypothetical protein ACE5DL_02410 [Nitrosopumilaceae archaeon]